MFELLLVVETCLLVVTLCVLAQCLRTLARLNEARHQSAFGGNQSDPSDQIVIEPDESARRLMRNAKLREIADFASLTDRECDILEYVYRGWKAQAIGKELCISEATVKTHMGNIYRKFDVHSQQEVISAVDSFPATLRERRALCD